MSSSRYRRFPLASTLALFVTACGDTATLDDEVGDTGDTDESGEAELATWTIFVYGHGDHNLSPSLVTDIQEMSRAAASDEINVIVLADFNGATEGYATGIEWYRIVGDGAEPELLEHGEEANLDDPAVLSEAIERAFTEYPAERHGLILWDHGGAWLGGFGGDTQDGTVMTPTPMLAAPLADSIAAGLDAAGVELEFLSLDTCLMAGAEVVAELAPLAAVYIADAEIDYGAGWDYEHTLGWLGEHPDAAASELALAEVEFWDAHHNEMGVADALLRSHVALDTERWPDFVAAHALFVERLTQSDPTLAAARAVHGTLPGYFTADVGGLATPPVLRDVGQFLARMQDASDPELAAAATTAREALDATILASSLGELRAEQSGLHIHLPLAGRVPEFTDLYAAAAPSWLASTDWDAALDIMYQGADAIAPSVTTDVASEPGVLWLRSDDPDVVEVEIMVAAPNETDSDLVEVRGLVGIGSVEPQVDYAFEWGNELLAIPDGAAGQQFVAVFPIARVGAAEQTILGIVGSLVVDGEAYESVIPFGALDSSADLVILTTGESSTATVGFSELPPGAVFTPVTPAFRASTSEVELLEGMPIPLTADGLPLSVAAAPSGNYVMLTSILDVYGNANIVADLVSVP